MGMLSLSRAWLSTVLNKMDHSGRQTVANLIVCEVVTCGVFVDTNTSAYSTVRCLAACSFDSGPERPSQTNE